MGGEHSTFSGPSTISIGNSTRMVLSAVRYRQLTGGIVFIGSTLQAQVLMYWHGPNGTITSKLVMLAAWKSFFHAWLPIINGCVHIEPGRMAHIGQRVGDQEWTIFLGLGKVIISIGEMGI
jgi:hypothetical protein